MTQQSNAQEQTSRPDMQPKKKPSNHPKNVAQISYQHPLKINNSSTHLGITIRWVPNQAPELIVNAASEVVG